MENEYDSLIPADKPAAPTNEYTDMLDQQKGADKSALQESMAVATAREPDTYAKATAMGQKTGIPADVVSRQMPAVARKVQLGQNDYDQILDQTPGVARWLTNPENASVSHDDVANLQEHEKTVQDYSLWKDAYMGLQSGSGRALAGLVGLPTAANDLLRSNYNWLADAVGLPGAKVGLTPESYKPERLLEAMADKWVGPAERINVIQEIGKGNVTNAVRGLVSQLSAGVPSLAALMATGGTPLATGAAVTMGAAQGGQALEQGLDVGANPVGAANNAAFQGVTGALMNLGRFSVFHDIEQKVAASFGTAAARDFTKEFLQATGKGGLDLGLQSAGVGVANAASEAATGVNPEAMHNLPQKAANDFLQGALTGMLLLGPGAAARGIDASMQAKRADLTRDTYLAMGASAEASKLKERLPQAYQDFVTAQTKGGPVENIYIPAEKLQTYFQSKGIEPTRVAKELGVSDAYDTAIKTGGDVQIPTAIWAAKVAGTEHYQGLADDVRFHPNDLSVNEAKELTKQVQAEGAQREAESNDSSVAVGENVKEQLKAAGIDEKTADSYAQVWQSAFKTTAERTGQDPMELFKKYDPSINQLKDVPTKGVDKLETPDKMTLRQDIVPTPDELTQLKARTQELESQLGEERRLRRTDELTGIRNKVAYDEDLKQLGWNTHSAIDMNVLKKFNDVLGHDGANDVIKQLASVLLKAQGEGDKLRFYRTGGDEFSGIHSGTEEEANAALEDLKNKLDSLRFPVHITDAEGNKIPVDIEGIGISYGAGGSHGQADARAEVNKRARIASGELEESRKPGQTRRIVAGERRGQGVRRENDVRGMEVRPGVDPVSEPGPAGTEARQLPEEIKPNVTLDQKDGESEPPRGTIDFGVAGKVDVNLLKDADLSTFLHETGHFFLKMLGDAADSSPDVKADHETVLKWLGADSAEKITPEHHEQFARGFEAYLMEGKAPSEGLRSAFSRFRAWLVHTYRQIKNLNVTLTPEVRGVFDRMLATQQEIDSTEAAKHMDPLFKNAQDILGAKADRYLKAVDAARIQAEDTLNKKALDSYAREKKAWYKDLKDTMRSQVADEVSKDKTYIALAALQEGKHPDGTPYPDGQVEKLSRRQTKDTYGEEALKTLDGKRLLGKDGEGIHPILAAELYGFGSGEELIKALAAAEPRKSFIERTTNERMAQQYPDALSQKSIPDEAMAALNGDKRAQVLRMELEHLAEHNMPVLKDVIRKVTRRVPPEGFIRDQAVATVGAQVVREINPYVYQRAEVRSAKEAGEALAKGDIDAAFEAKKRELMNHELYKAANDAQDAVNKATEDFKRFAGTDDKLAAKRDMDLVNAGRAILAQFGIGRSEKTASAYLDAIKRYDPEIFETVQAMVNTYTSGAKNFKEIPLKDFKDMRDAVDAIWDMSRRNRQIEIDGQLMDREIVQTELQNRLADLAKPGARVGLDKAATNWEKTKRGLMGARSYLRRVESWVDAVDGVGGNGAFRRYVWNPISEGAVKFRLAKADYLAKYLDVVKEYKDSLTDREIPAPELGYTFKNKAELMGAILHTGNESNLSKLLRGRRWGAVDEDGNLHTERWDSFIKRMHDSRTLSKADYDYAQKVWDLFEEMKSGAQKAHKEMYGHYFDEITAKPFDTPFGTYAGGYVPAKADPFVNSDASIRAEKDSLEHNDNAFMFPTTGRGFTKGRVDAYAAPLTMDLRMVPSHIDSVQRFVNIEPRVKDVGRIVTDRDFRRILDDVDPTAGADMLTPWLQRSAQQLQSVPSKGAGGKMMDTFWRELRTRTGLQMLTASVSDTLWRLHGISIAAVKVPIPHLRDALWRYMRQPGQVADDIHEKSDYMKTRQGLSDIQKNIDKIIDKRGIYGTAKDFATEHAHFMQAGVHHVLENIIWSGAYDHGLEKGMTDPEAVKHADSAVRLTQGDYSPESVSRFEAGSQFMKAFSMFYGFYNNQANLLGSEFSKVSQGVGLRKGAGRLLYVYTMGMAIPAVLGEAMYKALAGESHKDDDDSYMWDAMSMFFGPQFKNLASMVPVAGPLVSAITNRFNDKWYDDKISTSPAVSAIESAAAAPHDIYEAIQGRMKTKQTIRDVLTALGMMSGIPLSPLAKPLGYLADVEEGKAEPTGPIDFTRGLATGKAGGN